MMSGIECVEYQAMRDRKPHLSEWVSAFQVFLHNH